MAKRLALPVTLLHGVLQGLIQQGVLVVSHEEPLTYVPAKALSRISVFDILGGNTGKGTRIAEQTCSTPEPAAVHAVFQKKQAALQQTLGPLTLRDLLVRLPPR